ILRGKSINKYMNMLVNTALICCAAVLLSSSNSRADTTVLAAASLKEALDEVAAQHGKATPEKIAVSYAASPALAKQGESGSPADIFISADLDWMDYLDKRNLLKAETRFNLLRNQIVLIAPADSKASIAIGP